ncbi:MAG TPA: prolyl oligopeptidase family serine peptidase [Chloroflexota bacterium]|nr:prolyl oligopeptidase family serine peptidase [Chloroflexota bacterium]
MREAGWRRRFRAPRVTLPNWAVEAPDRLLYGSNASGKWELYAWDRATGFRRQVTDRPEGTSSGAIDPTGAWIWWFDDRKGDEMGGWMVEPFSPPEGTRYPAAGWVGHPGAAPRLAAPELPPAYQAGLALGPAFAVIGRAAEGVTTVHRVAPDGGATMLYRHREDAGVAGLSRDGTLIVLHHSEHGDSRHPALRVIDPEGRAVAELWDGPGRGLRALDWSPVGSDQRLLVRHEREEMPRPLIWNVARDEARELRIDLPGELGASWYPDARALLIGHSHRGRSELYRLELAGERLERIETEPGTIGAARVHPSGQLWYDWSSAATPHEVRADRGVLLRPEGEPAPGGVAYRDGEADRVHFFVAEPPGPRPHPTIFHVHGGPHAHDRDEFSPRVQAWVDHGFAVVLMNYRGSSGYGRAWRDALEGNPGLTELEDVARVHERVVRDGVADPGRSVLAGGSWGGYVCLLGLGLQPERWSLGVASVPVADYVAAFEDEMEPLKAFDRALFGGSPDEIPERYRERSPIAYVDRVRVPVLILAGENDPRCPIRQIDNYLARLRELGKPHEVYRYDAGHGSLVVDESIRQLERQIAFAAEHLGTPPPRSS